jgi:hypothetical protein
MHNGIAAERINAHEVASYSAMADHYNKHYQIAKGMRHSSELFVHPEGLVIM